MRRDLPYAIIVPAVMVGFAVVLMIWAIAGGGARSAGQGVALITTGAAPSRPSDSAVRSPGPLGNDGAEDSVRAIRGPENKTR